MNKPPIPKLFKKNLEVFLALILVGGGFHLLCPFDAEGFAGAVSSIEIDHRRSEPDKTIALRHRVNFSDSWIRRVFDDPAHHVLVPGLDRKASRPKSKPPSHLQWFKKGSFIEVPVSLSVAKRGDVFRIGHENHGEKDLSPGETLQLRFTAKPAKYSMISSGDGASLSNPLTLENRNGELRVREENESNPPYVFTQPTRP